MAYDVDQLLKMTTAELDEIFTTSPAGDIPDGDAEGTAILAPGTSYAPDIARFINHFAWQGKIFDAKAGFLKNKILPLGVAAIIARIYKDKSWFDGKECIVLDYSQTSIVAGWIRDEIRMIGPDFYLGLVFGERKKLFYFTLKF